MLWPRHSTPSVFSAAWSWAAQTTLPSWAANPFHFGDVQTLLTCIKSAHRIRWACEQMVANNTSLTAFCKPRIPYNWSTRPVNSRTQLQFIIIRSEIMNRENDTRQTQCDKLPTSKRREGGIAELVHWSSQIARPQSVSCPLLLVRCCQIHLIVVWHVWWIIVFDSNWRFKPQEALSVRLLNFEFADDSMLNRWSMYHFVRHICVMGPHQFCSSLTQHQTKVKQEKRFVWQITHGIWLGKIPRFLHCRCQFPSVQHETSAKRERNRLK